MTDAQPKEVAGTERTDDLRRARDERHHVADPDVVLVHPCGFEMARTLEEMPLLEHRPGWRELKAVQSGRIFVADGNQYFNRPGPRVVESLEILAEIFQPELFPSRYEGKGWMHYVAEPRVER